MTTTAKSIIKDVQVDLQDEGGTRWPASDLVGYLNDGQREIAVLRPEMFAVTAPLVLAGGARQLLPDVCINLMEVPCITGGRAISKVDRSDLDAINPSWYSLPKTGDLQHFCYDAKTPRVMYAYPPAVAGTSVDIVYSVLPIDVEAPSGPSWSNVTGNIGCDDIFKNALRHYMLFRAYAKDAESGSSELSSAHYQLFKTFVGSDVSAGVSVSPK